MPAVGVRDQLTSQIIHGRFGHMGASTLEKIVSNQIVDGIDGAWSMDTFHRCKGCALGRSRRAHFGSVSQRAPAVMPMHRIFCDVMGPINPSSGRYRYVSLIIDEFTRFISIRLIVTKDEATEHVIEWTRFAERMHGIPLRIMHSDNGGEYTSIRIRDWARAKGVVMEFTTKGTPEWNGMAERANQTIEEMARAMMCEAELPARMFWSFAIEVATKVCNYRPHPTNQQTTPFMEWFKVRPHIGRLRVFGCDAFTHILKPDRAGKMCARSYAGVMVG
jgi:transposase InsO family protein